MMADSSVNAGTPPPAEERKQRRPRHRAPKSRADDSASPVENVVAIADEKLGNTNRSKRPNQKYAPKNKAAIQQDGATKGAATVEGDREGKTSAVVPTESAKEAPTTEHDDVAKHQRQRKGKRGRKMKGDSPPTPPSSELQQDGAAAAPPAPAPPSANANANSKAKKHSKQAATKTNTDTKPDANTKSDTNVNANASANADTAAADTNTSANTAADTNGAEVRLKPKDKRAKTKTKKNADGSTPLVLEIPTVAPVEWKSSAWFTGCDANLVTSYWLLSRCTNANDTVAPENEAVARRAVELLRFHEQLKEKLLPQDEPEDVDESGDGELVSAEVIRRATELLALSPELASVKSLVLSQLRVEVLEAASDMLVSRTDRDDLFVLTEWEAFLKTLVTTNVGADIDTDANDRQGPTVDGSVDAVHTPDVDQDQPSSLAEDTEEKPGQSTEIGARPSTPVDTRRPRSRTFANVLAFTIAHVGDALAFQRTYDRCEAPVAPARPVDAHIALWTAEIDRIVAADVVDAGEESRRRRIAVQIEASVRRHPHWRRCQVLLFGSSLSKFGSKTSDMDLCLRADPDRDVDGENAVKMSARELRLRKQRARESLTMAADAHDPVAMEETLDKTVKALEALANTIDKKAKKTKQRDANALRKLVQLRAHWQALVSALAASVSEGTRVDDDRPQRGHRGGEDPLAALRKQQKEQQRDIHLAASVLERHGCKVNLVVAHARVPVIKFTHVASGMECDMCFENYHACINTLLLRTYAEVDTRARALGLAIKHWAKRRGINDASTGHLSSYSFILLVIYFLQAKAKVLPNLQDPALLALAHEQPFMLNGVDVAYCRDIGVARTWQAMKQPQANDASVGELLRGFFAFYVHEFDFGSGVVSVREPEVVKSKRGRWGKHRLRAWRLSLEDPLEKNRDLGSVLQLRCQKKILEEMKRALDLLTAGESFEHSVCAPSAVVVDKRPGAAANAKAGGGGTKPSKKRQENRNADNLKQGKQKPPPSKGATPVLTQDEQEMPPRSNKVDGDKRQWPHKNGRAPRNNAAPAPSASVETV